MYNIFYNLILFAAKCKEIDAKYPNLSKTEPRCGFNIGFDLEFWQKWCKLANTEVSGPVMESLEFMKKDNFMVKHKKLQYTDGDIWMYLKAEKKDDCEELLEVIH